MQHAPATCPNPRPLTRASFSKAPALPAPALEPLPQPATRTPGRVRRYQRDRDAEAQARRAQLFDTAASVATQAGYPITFVFCLTWRTLNQGERRPGHSLGLPEPARVSRLWRNLKNLCHRHGLPFCAMRAPEYDAGKGSHLHVAIHLPPHLLPDLLDVLSRLTGAPHDVTATFTSFERKRGHLARSGCKGWLVQRNVRVGTGGEQGAAEYLSKARTRAGVVTQYRLSDFLSGLVRGVEKHSGHSNARG
jgi:hypothetical protein